MSGTVLIHKTGQSYDPYYGMDNDYRPLQLNQNVPQADMEASIRRLYREMHDRKPGILKQEQS